MAAIKLVLRKETKKDGTSPLAIRITKDRKSSYIYLDYSVKPEQWDGTQQRVKKSHPNATWLNHFLLKKLAEANEKALELESARQHVSPQTVRRKVKPTAGSTLFAQADLYLQRLRADGKFNRFNADSPRVKHLKEFLKHDMAFQDVTITLIERFKAWLKHGYRRYAHSKQGMSERSAVNHLVVLRSIFAQAIAEGACDEKFYPFGKGKLKIKFPDSRKEGLTREEVARLEETPLEGPADHARNLWLVSYYFAGIRISDVLRLQWDDIRDGRLYYIMGKNAKGDSLKVSDKAMAIFERYRLKETKESGLIFPDLAETDLKDKFETQRAIANRTNAIDTLLRKKVAPACKIDKKLTMHIARHTFGNLSGDKIPVQMLQKLYRHSSITTTIGYQANFMHKDADDALDAVIGG
ncbi:tyrosine-type recombinase/integrase [bacterium]|nr:MAG: tyrosine-type recombinase/integrase [bacterium]